MPPLEIRRLKPDEISAFKAIRLEALRNEPLAFASTVADWESLPDEEWRRRIAENAVFAAFRGNDPVALMGLMRQKSNKRRHRATLGMVYVRRSERGTGLAGSLLDAVICHARQSGIRQVELGVNSSNSGALRFYERNGFAAFGLIPAASVVDSREIDEIEMFRRIDIA
jgi:ribosomal protein S18 acetylase RimI-like enzyme